MTRGLKKGILGLCMGFCIVITACSLFYDKDDVDFVDGVAFSPSKECENTIIKLINSSSEQIDVAVFDINNENIVNALKSAHDKGKKIRTQLEVDFVVNQTDKRYYIQSALTVADEEKRKQEINSLNRIDDSYVKIVVVRDNVLPWTDDKGIQYINIEDFLLEGIDKL